MATNSNDLRTWQLGAALASMVVFCLLVFFLLILPYFAPSLQLNAPASMVTIDATSFPDVQLRNYVSANFDKDGDGKLSERECAAVKSIGTYDHRTYQVTDMGIAASNVRSLDGIGSFPNLESLVASGNSLTMVDITGNPKLRYLDLRSMSSFDLSYGADNLTVQVLVDESFAASSAAGNLNIVRLSSRGY